MEGMVNCIGCKRDKVNQKCSYPQLFKKWKVKVVCRYLMSKKSRNESGRKTSNGHTLS